MLRAPGSDVLVVGGGAAGTGRAAAWAVTAAVGAGHIVNVTDSDAHCGSLAVSSEGNGHDDEKNKMHCWVVLDTVDKTDQDRNT